MKVYLVNAGSNYYPDSDNTLFIYEHDFEAERTAKVLEDTGNWDWVEIYEKDVT